MQKVLTVGQVAKVHSQIEVDAMGARFLNACACDNCGAVDPLHDSSACFNADYVQWRAMRDAELFELRFDYIPQMDDEEIEVPEPWADFSDDEPYFARLEREGLQRAMYA